MSDDIPFDKRFDLPPGQVEEVAPGIRRLLCNNPGPFTFKGTVSYIVGRGRVAIIDPGPVDEAHIAALLDAVRGETVTHIIITHTHRDHSPAAARIKAATGAPRWRRSAPAVPRAHVGEGRGSTPATTLDFRPDRTLADGVRRRWLVARAVPRQATPPTTWLSPSGRETCCSPATTSWRGRRRWWRRRTGP
jgi:glyoxylase-like metal-dependent hydrolase (beta-lactamase superfamily II)